MTNFGYGSKFVENNIKLYENGERSKNEIYNDIKKYCESRINSQQVLGDVASATASMGIFSLINNFILMQSAQNKVGAGGLLQIVSENAEKTKLGTGLFDFFKNITKTKRIGIAVAGAVVVGAVVKKLVLKINRIGSKEFKYDKAENADKSKEEQKAEKRLLKKARKKENRKNFWTGALNGLLTPLVSLAGGIAGVPVYIAINQGMRYLRSKSDEDKITVKGLGENIKNNAALNAFAALVMAAPLYKNASYTKVLAANLEKVVAKLQNAKLKPAFENELTAYKQLEEMLLESKPIDFILTSDRTASEMVGAIINENIFAAKFLQISNESGKLGNLLRENCPSSRTLAEAKTFIANSFGNKYDVIKQLGVGTVAETYLAKELQTGKEVCIKIIKNGIDAEKINKDKQKMIDLIKSTVRDSKEQIYLINNVESLAKEIVKEVDLTNEMDAAKKLKPFTKEAKVVEPIEIKNNVYVMEKAPGISLRTLQEAADLEGRIKYYKRKSSVDDYYASILVDAQNRLDYIKTKSPEFGELNMKPGDIDRILDQYIKVKSEQFDRVYRNGKILHADIHPGNVFVDLQALSKGKGKILTLIDTGNTIHLSAEQSQRALMFNQYIRHGNVKDITKYVLDGASLPNGMTAEKAAELVEKDLKKIFFDNSTKLNYMQTDSMLNLSDNVLRKHNILPASTQSDLEKAKHAASQSFVAVRDALGELKFGEMMYDDSNEVLWRAKALKEIANWNYLMSKAQKTNDAKNLTQLSIRDIINARRNPNMLKTNSEDYLTYNIKQDIGTSKEDRLERLAQRLGLE